MDNAGRAKVDEINYKNVITSIDWKKWINAGNHTTGSFVWDTSGIDAQTGIDLRVRAIDVSGTNTYSSYFTKGSSLTIQHQQNLAETLTESIAGYDGTVTGDSTLSQTR